MLVNSIQVGIQGDIDKILLYYYLLNLYIFIWVLNIYIKCIINIILTGGNISHSNYFFIYIFLSYIIPPVYILSIGDILIIYIYNII
jgi:hypothetical protein